MNNNNKLQAPLIKSAALLAVFCLLVYFTGNSPEGSVWAALGTILYGVFRTVQLGVGLALGLLLCLVVLIGIFLGSVALVSKDSAAKMYNQLRRMVVDNLLVLKGKVMRGDQQKTEATFHDLGTSMQTEISTALAVPMKSINERHDRLETSLAALHSRLEQFVQNDDRWTPADRFERLAEEVTASGETMEEIRSNIQTLQGRIQDLTPSDRFAELLKRIEAFENRDRESASALENLAQQVESLQTELAELKTASATGRAVEETDSNPDQDEAAHRFLSYFENPDDRKKLDGLLAETLKQDMTYSQVIDYLIQKSGDEVADVIAAHPSLVKDYIRQCRKGM